MKLISVDFQNDFVSPGGVHFGERPCVQFVTETVVPWARAHRIGVAEIISDYRSPNGGESDATCVPGQWGYESAIPADVKSVAPWVKASIAPTWVRDGGGSPDAVPGPARPDPIGFTNWLEAAIGRANDAEPVVIIGLMLEVCVLATLIEIRLRGYPATVLIEGVDTADGDPRRKLGFLETLAVFWGSPVTWTQTLESVGTSAPSTL